MEILILLPAIFAVWFCVRTSPARAFLMVYFPAMLLLPNYYRLQWSGVPKVNFAGAAIIPIAAFYLVSSPRWKLSLVDCLLIIYFCWFCVDEFINPGTAGALRALAFEFTASTALPCILARQLIEPNRMRMAFAKQVVGLLAVVAALNVYEFRLGVNLFRTIGNKIFAAQPAGWVTQLRWGFARTSGPFGHAILAGVIMSVGFMICFWVLAAGEWRGTWMGIPRGKQWLCGLASSAGVLMTMSRGPWMGVLLSCGIAVVGQVKNVKRAMVVSAIVIGAAALFVGVRVANYSSVGRMAAQSAEQETAAYRREMLDDYIPVVMERPWVGWGMTFPRVPGEGSIDNHYLLLALIRGLTGLGIFLTIIAVVLFRVLRKCADENLSRTERTWGFTLLGALVCILISIATVYMGEQLGILFWILIGWSEGWVTAERSDGSEIQTVARAHYRPLAYARVIQ